MVNAASGTSRDSVSSVVIEELAVFPHNTVIKELRLMHRQRGGGSGRAASGRQRSLGRLAVMSDREVRSIAVSSVMGGCVCVYLMIILFIFSSSGPTVRPCYDLPSMCGSTRPLLCLGYSQFKVNNYYTTFEIRY